MENKVVKLENVTVEEQVSKKGKRFKAIYAVVNGQKKLVLFVNDEIGYALYKAGIRI